MALVTGTSFALKDTITSSDVLGFDDPAASATHVINGVTYVYQAAETRLEVFTLDATGTLTFVTSFGNSVQNPIVDARGVTAFTAGGNDFVLLSTFDNDGVIVFAVSDMPPHVTPTASVYDIDNAAYELNGAWATSVYETGASAFAYIAGYNDDGISVFEISDTGTMTFVEAVTHTGSNGLNAPWVSNVFGTTLVTAGYLSNAVSVWSIDQFTGVLTLQDTFADLVINGSSHPSVMEIDGVLTIFVPAFDGDSIVVLTYDSLDGFEVIQEIQSSSLLNGAAETSLFEVGDKTYLSVSSYNSDTVTVFEVDTGPLSSTKGTLSAIEGGVIDNLNRPNEATFVTVDGVQFMLVGSENNNELVVYEIGGGDDVLTGTNGDDTVTGFGGDDIIYALGGDDVIDGGGFSDVIYAGSGIDTVIGSGGNDVTYGGSGYDTFDMSVFNGEPTGVTVDLFNSKVVLPVGLTQFISDFERVFGTKQADILTGDYEGNDLRGDSGADVLRGLAGDDFLRGGNGADSIYGGDDNDFIDAGGGDDAVLNGGTGDDTIEGGTGIDGLFGGDGNDILLGEDDADLLRGNAGDDTLEGGNGADDLRGGDGNDELDGGADDDFLFGDGGADTLDGGSGANALTGGAGNDLFVFADSTMDGFNSIKDFTDGEDQMLVAYAPYGDFADIQAVSSQKSWGVRIDLDAGVTIAVEGMMLGDLDASDFLFL